MMMDRKTAFFRSIAASRVVLAVVTLSALSLFGASKPAHAVCSNPAGVAGDVMMNTTYNVPQYCNDTNWIAMRGAEDLTASASSSTLTDGLISHWEFEDGTGSTAVTDSVGSNDGSLTNMDAASDWVAGQIGDSLDFDGSNDYVTVPNDPSLDFGSTQDFSLSFWFLTRDNTAYDDLVGKDGTYGFVCNYSFGISSIECYLNGDSSTVTTYAASNATPLEDTWYHVVWTVDRDGNAQLYIDGTASGSAVDVSGAGNINSGTNLWFGDVDFTFFNGGLDDIRIYNRVLSSAEASELYTCGSTGSCATTTTEIVSSGLVGHWKLDETTGNTAFDSSGNGYDATYVDWSLGVDADTGPGPVGTSIGFDGTQDHIEVTQSFALAEFTVCGWFWPTANALNRSALASKFESTANGWWIEYENGQVYVKDDIGSPGADEILYTTAMPAEQWSHFCGGINASSNNFLYVNGELIGDNDAASGSWDTITASSIFLGQRGNDAMFLDGRADDYRLYNRTLTASEVEEIASYRPNFTKIVTDGLVGYWRLDETSGTTAEDSTGNGNDGTIVNSPTLNVNGIINTAFEFDRTNHNYIDVTNTGNIFETPPFSFSFWTKFDQLSTTLGDRQVFARMIHSSLPWHSWQVYLGSTDNVLAWQIRNSDASVTHNLDSNVPLSADTWYHVAGTIDSSFNAVFYIDGIAQTDTASLDSFYDADGDLRWAGNNGFNNNLGGIMDDIRFYNRALDKDEILELYQARDGIRYNASHNTMEYFDGNQWVSMTQNWENVDVGPNYAGYPNLSCPNIGDVCSDGSVYAGLSPDGDVPMYTTPADAPSTTWGNAGSQGPIGTANNVRGENNTRLMAQDAVTYPAAEYCYNLNAHSNDDWYLPARDELITLWNARNTGTLNGTFDPAGNTYYSSTDGSTNSAIGIRFLTGGAAGAPKGLTHLVRCVRKADVEYGATGGLIGHWKLDETEGTTAYDSSTNGNDGTMNGGMDAADDAKPGTIGTTLAFDGVDDTITIADPGADSILDFDDGDTITVSAWVQDNITSLANNDFHTILVKSFAGSNQANYGLQVEEGDITFFYRNAANDAWHIYTSDTPYFSQAGDWHHVTATYTFGTGSSLKLYVDGNLVSGSWTTGNGDDAPVVNNNNVHIGSYSPTSPYWRGGIDDVRIYDRALSPTEITKLYQMGAPVGSSTALPQGCPNIGDVCDDGTIYAGLSPDGSVEMFTTPENAPSTAWNSGNSSNFGTTGATSNDSGADNTSNIVITDSDTGTSGFQQHPPAQYCYDLVQGGADDWYLPSINELLVIEPNYQAIGGFSSEWVWSSTESSASEALARRFPFAFTNPQVKFALTYQVRCARKGPAPRCANPYGVEGTLLYNTTHNVMQYCDGSRWIGIGGTP